MRSLRSFTLAALIGLTVIPAAWAQTAATPAPAPTAPATAPATTPPALTARPITPPARHRLTRTQRFEAANTTHDGHLTLAQAKAANMSAVAKNFDAIDTAKKGYVTLDELNAYYRTRHRTTTPKAAPASAG